MQVVIMGCGRVGSQLAIALDAAGHAVTVIDIDGFQFKRFLPATFGGKTIAGDATDIDNLRRAGVEQADAFVAAAHGDNRNIMAAQIAQQIFGVKRVVCRVLDPEREELYHSLGLQTVSQPRIIAQMFKEALEQ